jgi:hypothetical protein
LTETTPAFLRALAGFRPDLTAAPNCEGIINRLQPIAFATQAITSMVRNVDTPAAFTVVEQPNAIGLVAWLFKRELIAKVSDEIRRQATRETEALDEVQRQTQEVSLLDQMMDCERSETSLIWALEDRGQIVDFRSTTLPAALLGVALITGRRR